MMSPAQPVAKPSLAYAKIVATPTETSWSQVYNAGSLFACLSLSVSQVNETISLQTIGKELFNNLETEFFTLEDKTLQSINDAIKNSVSHISPDVVVSLCLSYFKDNILYLFILGAGTILMKRDENVGILLEQKDVQGNEIVNASGYLQNNDSIVLETHEFAQTVSMDALKEALDLPLPNDIAETLSPQIHEKGGGSQSAIIIIYHGVNKSQEDDFEEELIKQNEQPTLLPQEEEPSPSFQKAEQNSPTIALPKLPRLPKLPHFHLPSFHLSHMKKLILSIIIIIIILLVVSIIFTKKKQQTTKINALFQQIYPQAQRQYEDGKALETLNKGLSHDDFMKADSMLKDGINKFPADSTEHKQMADLLNKIEAELGTGSSSQTTSIKETSVDTNDFLNIEKANTDSISFGQGDGEVYMITAKNISTIDASGKKKEIIKNNNDWASALAVVPYQGNIYLLDEKNGVLKYVSSGQNYDKTSYFKGQTPDISQATAMAIDGSIWILSSNGTLLKYTKGEQDSFKITGLDKPLASPTKIFTTIDTDSIYILDKGNGRIVKLDKKGSFQSQYAANLISQASDFEVREKDKKIYILSNQKIYQIDL